MGTSPRPTEGDGAVSTRSGVRARAVDSKGEAVSTRSGVRARPNVLTTMAPFTMPIDSSPE